MILLFPVKLFDICPVAGELGETEAWSKEAITALETIIKLKVLIGVQSGGRGPLTPRSPILF